MGLLEDLAVRCEASTGADRELDRAIELALPAYEDAKHLAFGVPMYSGSLDAATSLIPPNHGISMGDYGFAADGRHHAELRPGGYQPGGQDTFDSKGVAATLPLAICAASLRAHHALALSKGDGS